MMLLALGVCLLSPLAAFSQDTLAEIKKRGSINVFVEAQYRPYEFRDAGGEIVGLDIDLARKMFEEGLGVKVVFTDLDLTGVLGSLLTRKADFVISGIVMTQERAKRFDLSIPYSEAGAAVLVRADEARLSGPDDLSGKIIGTQLGSSSQKAAEAFDAQLKAQGKPGYAELKTYERFPHRAAGPARQADRRRRAGAAAAQGPHQGAAGPVQDPVGPRTQGVLRRRGAQGRHRAAGVRQRPDPQVQAGRDAQGAAGEMAGRVGPHAAGSVDAPELRCCSILG
jgi:ABC-type amino acid transport substrate-binding protein